MLKITNPKENNYINIRHTSKSVSIYKQNLSLTDGTRQVPSSIKDSEEHKENQLFLCSEATTHALGIKAYNKYDTVCNKRLNLGMASAVKASLRLQS